MTPKAGCRPARFGLGYIVERGGDLPKGETSNMIQRIIFSGVFILCAIQGWADEIPVQSIDGGGAVAASGSVMLTGAIASHGLPGDLSGVSANATVQLSVGYFPVLSIQVGAMCVQ